MANWNEIQPPTGSVPEHQHAFQIPDLPTLVQLAEALGGGSYPGMGSGINDTMPNQDSVAPGFPLKLFFVVAANQVKQQALKLSFQPDAFRTYFTAGQSHSHAGDPVTINIDSTNEAVGHVHQFAAWAIGGTEPNTEIWNMAVSTDGATTLQAQLNTSVVPSLGNNDRLYTTKDFSIPSHHYHSHVHTNTPGTTGNSNAGGAGGVSESTNPDNMRVLVDGTDVTTQLGGPWNTAQTELDITPYAAPGSGIHVVQVTTATNLGRITGWVRNSSIINALRPA